jgi:hypothetical protein
MKMCSVIKRKRENSINGNKILCNYCETLNETNEEIIVLTNNNLLSLYDYSIDNSNNRSNDDERPQHRVTQFVIHDNNSVLCGIDDGNIENDINIYLCGFVSPIVDHFECNRDSDCDNTENTTHHSKIAAKMIGNHIYYNLFISTASLLRVNLLI